MGDLLQNVGIFICVGALILVALAVFGVTSMLRRNRGMGGGMVNRGPAGYGEDDRVLNERGTARPQYDDRDVTTAGGFGGVPTTGGTGARDFGDVDNTPRQDTFRDLDDRRQLDDDTNNLPRRRRQDDDDNIRSSGGFGG